MKSRLEMVASFPWGKGENGIRPEVLDYPASSLILPGQLRQRYAPLRFHVDVGGGVHVLNKDFRDISDGDDVCLAYIKDGGVLDRKTPIPENVPESNSRRIIDFAVDGFLNYFLLENYKIGDTSYNKLSKIDGNGKIIWGIEGPFEKESIDFPELRGDFNKLLIDGQGNLYLTSASNFHTVALIDTVGGGIENLYTIENGSKNSYINRKGDIVNIVYFENRRRRGLSLFNPALSRERMAVGSKELFGLLLYPFGVDDQLNCYVSKVPNVYDDPGIVKISFDGRVVHQENFKDLVVRSEDSGVFSGLIEDDTLKISGFLKDGLPYQRTVRFPDQYSNIRNVDRRLIKVDEFNRFYVLMDERSGGIGTLLIFSEDGRVEEEVRPPENLLSLESWLPPYSYWQVDGDSHVYFPILNPDSFKVVRWTLNM